MTRPVDSIIANGVAVAKEPMRVLLTQRFPYIVADADESLSLDLQDVFALVLEGRFYLYDITDVTTAHDGATCLVSADGRRYKQPDGGPVSDLPEATFVGRAAGAGTGPAQVLTAEEAAEAISPFIAVDSALFHNSIYLGNGFDLNNALAPGYFDVLNPVNAPWAVSWAYLRVQNHSANPLEWVEQVLTHLGAGPAQDQPVAWHRLRRGGFGWGPWRPIKGYVAPSDLGGSAASSLGAASTDDTAAINRWVDYGLANPRVPMVIDGFYKLTGAVSRNIGSVNGFGFRTIGPAGRAGFFMAGSASLFNFEGADQSNPSGFDADQYHFDDFMIGIDADRSNFLMALIAAPDSGSDAPGLQMRNIHVRRASDGAGVTGFMFYFQDIRQFDVQNVSAQGKYFGYQGIMFQIAAAAGGAPVEGCFTNCRVAHAADMFNFAPSSGAVAFDDWQGMHLDRCTGIGVNRLVYAESGPDTPGFSEWLTVSRCHAYYRDTAVGLNKVGNVKVTDSYFLGHGNQSVIQGIGKTGSSIVDPVTITNNTFKFDATGATRLWVNLPAGQVGVVDNNGQQNATGQNLGATTGTNYSF